MATKEKPLRKQHQSRQPGLEYKMEPRPESADSSYRGSGKLKDKVALMTGGDSGIGRAVAIAFAKEGAQVCVVYYDEHRDAEETVRLVEEQGRKCILVAGDVGDEAFCKKAVKNTVDELGRLDIVINNAAVQYPRDSIEEISSSQLEKTFRTNIYSYFFITKAAMPQLGKGSTIINTTSVTAYRGSSHLIDYSATKGAIVTFTRSLAKSLVEKRHSCQRSSPGTHLDSADCRDHEGG